MIVDQLRIFRTAETSEDTFEYRLSLRWLLCRNAVIAIKKIHPRLKLPTRLIKWCGRHALQRRMKGGRWRTLLTDDHGCIVEVL